MADWCLYLLFSLESLHLRELHIRPSVLLLPDEGNVSCVFLLIALTCLVHPIASHPSRVYSPEFIIIRLPSCVSHDYRCIAMNDRGVGASLRKRPPAS